MPNKKEEVLKKLKNTYCRLRPSAIEGVGVFAIKDIPKNINPFKGVRNQRWYKFNISQLKKLNKEVLKMIDDFNVIEEDKTVLIPECAFNDMDASFFVNNSESPNLKTIDNGLTFITLRKIKKSEELTVAYETYDHKYKKR
jgi:SET domain-containing protein